MCYSTAEVNSLARDYGCRFIYRQYPDGIPLFNSKGSVFTDDGTESVRLRFTDGGWAVDGDHEDEQLGDRSHLFCRSLIRRRLLSADYGFCLDDLVDDEDKEPRP